MPVLSPTFYQHEDVVLIAKQLLGKKLYTKIGSDPITGGIISETEAYRGPDDKACHAYNYRRTPRNEAMFLEGGVAYVYLCYGMHNLLNVVTGHEEIPHAILIRSIIPTHGLETIARRRKKNLNDPSLMIGPGKVCQGLGITRSHNEMSLTREPLWIEEGEEITEDKIEISTRIGIAYAGEDALLPWRFILKCS